MNPEPIEPGSDHRRDALRFLKLLALAAAVGVGEFTLFVLEK